MVSERIWRGVWKSVNIAVLVLLIVMVYSIYTTKQRCEHPYGDYILFKDFWYRANNVPDCQEICSMQYVMNYRLSRYNESWRLDNYDN